MILHYLRHIIDFLTPYNTKEMLGYRYLTI